MHSELNHPHRETAVSSESTGAADPNLNSSADWNAHEHQSERVRAQAHQLVEETGSTELAKHAIDEAAHQMESIPDQAAFARQFGFESYLAMFEASTPLTADDGRHWLVATTTGGQWVAWNERDLTIYQRFLSLQDASRSIGAEGGRIG